MSAPDRRRAKAERRAARGDPRALEAEDGAASALLRRLRELIDASTEANQRRWTSGRHAQHWPGSHRVGDQWIGGAMNLGRMLWIGETAIRPGLIFGENHPGGAGRNTSSDYTLSMPGWTADGSGVGKFSDSIRSVGFALEDHGERLVLGVRAVPEGAAMFDFTRSQGRDSGWSPADLAEPGPDRTSAPVSTFERLLALRRLGVLSPEHDASGALETALDARLARANAEALAAGGAPLSLPAAMKVAFYVMNPLRYDVNLGDYANRPFRISVGSSVSAMDDPGRPVPCTVAVAVWDEEKARVSVDVCSVMHPRPDVEWEHQSIYTRTPWLEVTEHYLHGLGLEKRFEPLIDWAESPSRIVAGRDAVEALRRKWHEGVAKPEVDYPG